ncbi:hypothetical protein CVD25_16745 [Bacillus canaveralius]|uniref:Flagellar protein FliT n=1 Tax=Bacillus canaveralius TaxID=1403243 RepID=A0A2N5GMS2_9BACI|nr:MULTISPECIES: hypothetical protein [Bacillus]PLR82572.1 hypothetical protein CVD23_16585 [Bacillus sp. V33-4]PLR83171.1 hypothetical protein CU635_09820 [Bacillus canaveralius]PLR94089.1 hypothetical protein CVD25_16745 [Bacillus canaveralius]RSK54111.1 hypothetical protein EJA13_05910 [Bacillus canaveralius]
MNQILSLIELTDKLDTILKEVPQGDQREMVIEEVTKTLDLREELLLGMKEMIFSDEEKEQLKQINEKNKAIMIKISQLKNIIQNDILTAKKGKGAFKGYHQLYQPSTQDGYYFDKKK